MCTQVLQLSSVSGQLPNQRRPGLLTHKTASKLIRKSSAKVCVARGKSKPTTDLKIHKAHAKRIVGHTQVLKKGRAHNDQDPSSEKVAGVTIMGVCYCAQVGGWELMATNSVIMED